jgi:GTP-binding protein HflX
VIEADLIVHVRDISHPDTEQQRADVETVLRELGRDRGGAGKSDRGAEQDDALPPENRRTLQTRCATGAERAQYPVSAKTGEGVDQPMEAIGDFLQTSEGARWRLSATARQRWLYRHGEAQPPTMASWRCSPWRPMPPLRRSSSGAGWTQSAAAPISGSVQAKETP